MSATVCASCGKDLLPGLEICFDCELPTPAIARPRAVRRYRINEPPNEPARLASLLAALCPAMPKEDVSWLVAKGSFDIVAEVTTEEDARLFALLQARAPQIRALEDARGQSSLRLSFSGRVREKLAAAAVVGCLGVAFGVPLVPFAAVAMSGVLVSRMVRIVPRRLLVERVQIGALLGPLPEAIVAEARAARVTITSPAVLEAFRVGFSTAAEVSSALRSAGAHLTIDAVSAADGEVSRVAKAVSKLALAAERAVPRTPPPSTGAPYRIPGTYDATLAQLAEVTRKLAELRATVAQVQVDQPRAEVLTALRTRAKQLAHASDQVLQPVGNMSVDARVSSAAAR
jgi:hypothetical protein